MEKETKLNENATNVKEALATINRITQDIDNSRMKLDEEVFIARHLPTIAKHGKPTEQLQEELVKLAGGENKRINLVDKDRNKVLTLPSAVSSGNTISVADLGGFKEVKKINPDGSILNNTPKGRDKVIETVSTSMDKLATDWDYVIEHYKDKIPKIVENEKTPTPKTKQTLETNSEDDYDYDA